MIYFKNEFLANQNYWNKKDLESAIIINSLYTYK